MTTNCTNNTNILFGEECYQIYNAIYEVHNYLGNGYLESVYQESLEFEFIKQKIPFETQKMFKIHYKDKILSRYFIADIVCFDKILLELKAISKINNEHKAQLINYLKASRIKLGLLVNFGTYPKVEIIRIVV